MVRLKCSTLFDITVSDPCGRTKRSTDKTQGYLSNQQVSNWNTIQQILMLRTLPENISSPLQCGGTWSFEFDVPNLAAVAWGADPVGALRYDANGVPMIIGLGETQILPNILVPYGDDANIWFEVLPAK
jgi:hypothetical protein